MVTAKLTDGRVLSRPFVKGEGLCSDSSPIITLGTGDAEIESLKVSFLDGKVVNPTEFGSGTMVKIE